MSIGTFSSLTKGGTAPEQASDQRAVRATIARAPASGDASLFVVVPGFSLALPYEVIAGRWETASNLPAAGASCLVVFDDSGDAWVPLWEGMIPGGAGGDTNTVLHGTVPPDDSVGDSGDFYIDESTWLIYGPKNGSWPAGESMIGPPGPSGAAGPPGAPGVKGDKGDVGATGQTGAQGATGATGSQGPTGVAGATGPAGPTGPKGADSTVPGPAGPAGPAGPMGTVYDSDQIGVVKTYAGATIPTNWMLCDGRALQRASYPDLFAALGGTSSPWGLPDSSTFNIPDLRSRMLVAAGQGTGLSSRAVAATGGEETHLLAAAESGVNGNGVTGTVSSDHSHAVSGTTGTDSPDHGHATTIDGVPVYNTSQGAAVTFAGGGNTFQRNNFAVGGATARHAHSFSAQSGPISANHTHALGARNADNAHNTMPPWCAVAFIIKALGTSINSGGALQGATGQRGAIWYMYNGAGTPAPGTFVGELDGDFAIRKSDGENFQRVAGAWVDQGFTNRTTAITTAARGYRNAALNVASATWTKVVLDAKSYDASTNLFDAPNGRFVAPVSGVYSIKAAVCLSISATGTYTFVCNAIWKNGAILTDPQTIPAVQSYISQTIADDVQLNAGDYLELYAYINNQAGAIVAGTTQTYMAVTLTTAGSGPQGPHGSYWFTYTGAGTPSAGTFTNEADGDMCVRTSDSEVFRRISGAWVDQGWTMKTGQQTMDIWHLVGNAGEPAFQNAWVNYGSGYQVGGFRKYPDGKVRLKGLVTGGATGTAIFTLPTGYRPPGNLIDVVETNGAFRVDVLSNGVIQATGMGTSGSWFSLDGIEFDTETVSVISAGSRGANWFTYTGAGTPAAGTFTGELDGDLAVRSSDSEVFKRIGGAWADQGYMAGGAIAQKPVCAKARRNGTVSLPGGFGKVPMDTVMFDSLGTICDAANGRMLIPVTGYYQVSAQLGEYQNAEMLVLIAVNGVTDVATSMRGTRTMQAGYNNGVASGLMSLTKGDYIEVYCYTPGAISLTCAVADMSWLSIALIQAGAGPPGPAGASGTTGPQGIPGGVGNTGARMYRNAALTTGTASTYIKVAFDTVGNDPGSHLQIATSRYVCGTAGWYQIDGRLSVVSNAVGQRTILNIYKNGTLASQGGDVGAAAAVQGMNPGIADLLYCNAGDYLELYYYCTVAGLSVQTGPSSYMSVAQVDQSGPQGPKGDPGSVAPIAMDPSHIVGNSGEPAFQNNWRQYAGSVNQFTPVKFRKFPDGRVSLVGLVDKSASGSAGNFNPAEAIFTLPPGYRPVTEVRRSVPMAGGSTSYGTGEIAIQTNGAVCISDIGGPANPVAWVSLSCEFDTESVTSMPAGPMGPAGPGGAAYAVQRTWIGAPGASVESYTPNFTAYQTVLTLTFTPTSAVWWEVYGKLGLVAKVDAAYAYALAYLVLNPVDQDGIYQGTHYITQHSQVQTNEGYEVKRMFRLAAFTTYTVSWMFGPSAGTWNYYQGRSQTYLEGKAWLQ